MGKSAVTAANGLLPEFQKFLRDKKLAPEKSVFFFALWASKFFNYARKKQIPAEAYQESAVSEFFGSAEIRSPSLRLADQTGERRNQALLFSLPRAQAAPAVHKSERHCARRPAQGDNAAVAAQALFLQY